MTRHQVRAFHLISKNNSSCIFHPYTNCNGKHEDIDGEFGDDDDDDDDDAGDDAGNSLLFISQITEKNAYLENAINISKSIIDKIENYNSFFAPIVAECSIEFEKIQYYKYCPLIKNATTHRDESLAANIDDFVSLKIRYIQYTIGEYIYLLNVRHKCSRKLIIQKIKYCYYYCLNSLEILCKNKIVHFNIMPHNIMYDMNQHCPIIVNFKYAFNVDDIIAGFSIDVDDTINYEFTDIYMDKLMRIFYNDNYGSSVHIDIVILSYFIRYYFKDNKKNVLYAGFDDIITVDVIKGLVDNYITLLKKQFTDDDEGLNAIQTIQQFFGIQDEFTLSSPYGVFISNYLGKHWNILFKDIFLTKRYEQWDKYSLYYSFYSIHSFIREPVKIGKNKNSELDEAADDSHAYGHGHDS